jgi:hemerythrin
VVPKEEKGIFVPWEDRYAVGIPAIDEQHRRLLDLTNALYDSCREGSTSAQDGFKQAAHSIVEYVKVHFTTEERLMDQVDYPEAASHKAEHKDFARQFLEEVKAFEEGKRFVSLAFANFLKDWILQHIALSDKKMGAYIVKAAKKGDFGQGGAG